MNPLLDQFVAEARDFLQGINEKLMALESAPDDAALMGELFRLVHTLKGNSGLFDFPEMSRVLHAAEDLMVAVREGVVGYSQPLADRLLDAMDFVSMLLDEIEAGGAGAAGQAGSSATLAEALRQLIGSSPGLACAASGAPEQPGLAGRAPTALAPATVPEALRMEWYRNPGPAPLLWVRYAPEPECFFKGEDPLYLVRQLPQLAWQHVATGEEWPSLPELDAYRCTLVFQLVTTAAHDTVEEHFRYVAEQVTIVPLAPLMLAVPVGDENGGPVHEDFVADALAHLDNGDLARLELATRSMLELSASGSWLASALRWLLLMLECAPANPSALRALIESLRTFRAAALSDTASGQPAPEAAGSGAHAEACAAIIRSQLEALGVSDQVAWLPGRLQAVAATLSACYRSLGREALVPAIEARLAQALAQQSAAPMLAWLEGQVGGAVQSGGAHAGETAEALAAVASLAGSEPKSARRGDEAVITPRTLKVDQGKIDRLMNLIGEMVVAKNGLPYLAARAESEFGVRELAREIKAQYAVINRIADDMQDAIMQVRMMPVSFIFQRFPRLVRDISRKLGKDVNLVLEGEDTEADKHIIEALADPLIHIVRNSLDHGIELPDLRRAAGKPAEGKLAIRALQEADRVIIEVSDDGQGIDPAVIKRKAYEKGLIDEASLERMSDREAIHLVFAAGFSTAETVSDLSGRGVGMDVVRSAVEKVNGTVSLESEVGKGTRLRLSLPLSMAVTSVMMIESDRHVFGIPMEGVVETVRVPRSAIHLIKNRQATVLRGRIVPLFALNQLLATGKPQLANAEDELAMLVIRVQGEHVGIVVDDFREVADIILKPMGGILAGMSGYAGTALLGDGSVLMVLNPKELLQ
jgi:two-component system chemotaxis sensor kinase CheA